MEYRREIDGLRALAVVPVILFHAGIEGFGGGFVGVDVFFVISGYLITSIIANELQSGTFSIARFYERRARRILPALFVVMLACLPFAWFWLQPAEARDFAQSLVAVPLFASNFLFWSESGYFDTAAEFKPLLHTWSLAVEEQYYVVFPLLLMLVWRLGRKGVWALLAAIAIASLMLAHWGTSAEPVATFYLLPARGWELLIGALVALYLNAPKRPVHPAGVDQIGALLGVVLVLYSIVAFDKATPFPSFYALIPTIGTALLILCAGERTLVGRLLSRPLLVGIGLVSYSAYLWHQPMFAFARQTSPGEPSRVLLGALAACSLALAFLTWKYVESPFRDRKRFDRRFIFSASALASMFFIAVGLIGHVKGGFPDRLPAAARVDGAELPRIDNGWCFYSIDALGTLTPGPRGLECMLGDKAGDRHGLLFGDSHGGHYEPLWDLAGKEARSTIHAVTTNYCHPSVRDDFPGPRTDRSFEQCRFNRKYLLDSLSKYDFAVFAGSWGDVLEKNQLDGALELIELAAARLRAVVVMATPRAFDGQPLKEYRRSVWNGHRFDIEHLGGNKDRSAAEANRLLEIHSGKLGNVVFVGRGAMFVAAGRPSDVTAEGIPFSLDGGHLSIYGSRAAAINFIASDEFARFRTLIR
jgi:peptidoglycan/LPS O-acetylase OafA/YrhL